MTALGIDTSNYTTSAALYDGIRLTQRRKLLPVKRGALGLRQSDALFAHTQQLPDLLDDLLTDTQASVGAVAVSDRPRNAPDSYMPCFLAGLSCARGIAAVLGVPLRRFSHQEGHLAAAMHGAGRDDLFERRCVAFHVSGGTTECLLAEPDKTGGRAFAVTILGRTTDLHAGQAVDRVGAMCGLGFPAGPDLDRLALTGDLSQLPRAPKPVVRDLQCSFSGLENQCRALLNQGAAEAHTARYCLEWIGAALEEMARQALERHPRAPLLFSGGVMGSEVIRRRLEAAFPAAVFAPAAFSGDNAAGLAALAFRSQAGESDSRGVS
ncbi:MAG: peptidase M22 [Oscillospiraceae bacterium]|jgi:N6-L-threonylcarbamoyladenine synthase|nr:peptidase M22 [Oscillospiraceae bacterium]